MNFKYEGFDIIEFEFDLIIFNNLFLILLLFHYFPIYNS